MLTGISVDYYAKMERGDISGVSPEILDALASSLRLDAVETGRLHELARAQSSGAPRRRARRSQPGVRSSLFRFLEAITGSPAWICDRRMTIIAANPLARALYAPIIDGLRFGSNTARFIFFASDAEVFFPEWERIADEMVGVLHLQAEQHPYDRELTDLIGELVTGSEDFSARWASPSPCMPGIGIKRIHHPLVGDLELHHESLELPMEPDRFLYAYTAEPGTPTAERLQLLGNLAADAGPEPDAEAEG